MLVDHSKEKREGAIAYFSFNTKHCYVLKLFRLLSFLDFEHYRQIGRSVTNYDYYAFKLGLIPVELFNDIEKESDSAFQLAESKVFDDMYKGIFKYGFGNGKEFDSTFFSPRELEIMEKLVSLYKDLKFEDMYEKGDSLNLLWEEIYANGEGCGLVIPYSLSLKMNPLIEKEVTITKEEIEELNMEEFKGKG